MPFGTARPHPAKPVLAALDQEARPRVYRALVGTGLEGMTPGALCAMLDFTGSPG
jgi:hypothetical protein